MGKRRYYYRGMKIPKFKTGLACAPKSVRRRVARLGGKARWRKAYRDLYRRMRRRERRNFSNDIV